MIQIPRSPCEEWPGRRNAQGYGVVHLPTDATTVRRTVLAHREAYERYNGPIPPGMHVCHVCDNPPCVKPEHLYLGSPRQNIRDMMAKGRENFRGGKPVVRHGPELRAKVLSDPRPANELAKEIGVSQHTICRWRREAGQPRRFDAATKARAVADPRSAPEVAAEIGVCPQTVSYWRQLARSKP